jgi:hypothetical protein
MADVRIDTKDSVLLTNPILAFLNTYPKFQLGESIEFGDASHEEGLAMYPISGALIVSETEDVTGGHESNRQYPFYLVYKSGTGSASRAISIKELLDDIGAWCESQNYSTFDDLGIEVTEISRQTVAAMDSLEENGTENWNIAITLFYTKRWNE